MNIECNISCQLKYILIIFKPDRAELGGLCEEGSRGTIGFPKGPVRSPGLGGAQRLGPLRSPTGSQISVIQTDIRDCQQGVNSPSCEAIWFERVERPLVSPRKITRSSKLASSCSSTRRSVTSIGGRKLFSGYPSSRNGS